MAARAFVERDKAGFVRAVCRETGAAGSFTSPTKNHAADDRRALALLSDVCDCDDYHSAMEDDLRAAQTESVSGKGCLEIQRIGNDRCSVHISWLARRAALSYEDQQHLVLDPPFQRGAVWTIDQKRAWIESILADLPLPAIFVNRFGSLTLGGHEKYGHRDVVIDGKQRILATQDFITGRLTVRGQRFEDQSETFRRVFHMTVVAPVIYTAFNSEVECAKLYLKLLTAGTAHTPEEIEKARAFVASYSAER